MPIYTVWLYDSLNSKEIELSEEEKTAILDSIKTSKMRLSLGYKNAVPDYILIIGYHKGHYSYNLNLQILHDTSYVKINDKIYHMRIINNDLYNILTDQVL